MLRPFDYAHFDKLSAPQGAKLSTPHRTTWFFASSKQKNYDHEPLARRSQLHEFARTFSSTQSMGSVAALGTGENKMSNVVGKE